MKNWLKTFVVASVILSLTVPMFAAAPTLGEKVDADSGGGVVTLAIPSGWTDGSGALVGISQTGSEADQNYSVAFTVGTGTFAAMSAGQKRGSTVESCHIFVAPNVQSSAGAVTAVITLIAGTAVTRGMLLEVEGMATSSPEDVSGGIGEPDATLASHPMASPGLNTLSDVFLFGIAAASGTNTTYADAGADWTSLTADFSNTASTAQYRNSSSPLTGETATWTNGVARRAANCLIAVKSTTSGSGTVVPKRTLMGVG